MPRKIPEFSESEIKEIYEYCTWAQNTFSRIAYNYITNVSFIEATIDETIAYFFVRTEKEMINFCKIILSRLNFNSKFEIWKQIVNENFKDVFPVKDEKQKDVPIVLEIVKLSQMRNTLAHSFLIYDYKKRNTKKLMYQNRNRSVTQPQVITLFEYGVDMKIAKSLHQSLGLLRDYVKNGRS